MHEVVIVVIGFFTLKVTSPAVGNRDTLGYVQVDQIGTWVFKNPNTL